MTFKDGTTTLCSNVALTGNTATCSVSNLSVAGQPAQHYGDYNGTTTGTIYTASTGLALTQNVNKATLTVTANDKSREYGAGNPVLDAAFSGFKNGESLGTSGVTGSASCSTTATATSPVNGVTGYPITCAAGSLAAGNYDFSFVAGKLSVTKATLTVTANDKSREYGAGNPVLDAAFSGFKNGESLGTSGVTGSASCSTTATATSPVNGVTGYPITCAAGSLAAGNYDFSFVAGKLSVTKKQIDVNAVADSKTYGQSDPVFGWTLSGFTNSENASGAGVTGSAVCSRTGSENAGSYTITCAPGTLAANNYSFVTGGLASFVITKATLTVTANDKSREYGAGNPVLDAAFSGFKNGESLGTSGVTGSASCSTTATATSPVNGVTGYPITCAAGSLAAGNYDFSFVAGKLSVTKKQIDVNAVADSKTYGQSDPVFGWTLSGFTNSENASGAGVTGSAVCSRTGSENAGSYTITCAPGTLAANNYSFVTGGLASFVINKATLTVTANDKSREYGAGNPVLDAAFSGFKNGESLGTSGVTGSASCSTTATATSPVNGVTGYPITCAAGSLAAGNYDFSFVAGKLSVTKATLTVTANDKSREYGAGNPVLDAAFSGFKNGESLGTSGVTGSASCSTTATATSPVNGVTGYPITCAAGSLAAGNYDFSFVAGKLSVTKKQIDVNAVADSKTYGQSDPVFGWTLSGFTNSENASGAGVTGSAVCSRTGSENAGSYTITCAPGTLAANNYSFVTGGLASFVINKATLTVTANDKSREYGAGNPVLDAAFSGFKNGESLGTSGVTGSASCSTTATATSPVNGVTGYPITCAAGSLAAGNYDFSFVAGKLSVTKATLTITADDRSKTYGEALSLGTSRFSTGAGELVNGDSVASVTLSSAGAAASAAKGDYDVTASAAVAGLGTDLDNYDVRYVRGTLAVAARSLTITADDRSKTYGEALSLGTSRFSTGAGELVNGDSVASVTLSSAGAAASAAKGDYDVTASAAVAGLGTDLDNYDVRYVRGTLAVAARSLTITADDRSKTYGEALSLGTSRFSTGAGELVNGDSVASVTLSSAGAAASAAKGDYDVTASAAVAGLGTDLDNYDVRYVRGTLAVAARSLTITADDRSKTYGEALSLGTSRFSTGAGELVNGDSVASVTLSSAGAAASAAKGDYDVTASAAVAGLGTDLDNYDVRYVRGTLAVAARSLTITADDRSKTYGEALSLGTSRFSTGAGELVNGDSVASVTLSSAGAAASAAKGDYDVTASAAVAGLGTDLDNYDVRYVRGTLAVAARSLTITADDRSKTYGEALSLGTSRFSTGAGELVNGDSVASVTLSSAGAAASAAKGDYDVTASAAVAGLGTDLDNYDVRYVRGTLAVAARSLTITADDRSKTYGEALSLGTSRFSTGAGELVNGDSVASVTLSSAGAAASAAKGDYDVTASAAVAGLGTDLDNYDVRYVRGTLAVAARSLTITADDRSKTYGEALSLGTSRFSTGAGELVNGDSVASVTLSSAGAAASAAKGDYDVTASAAVAGLGTDLDNYDVRYVRGTLAVAARSLTITADDRSKTYGEALSLGTSRFSTGAGELVNGDSVASVTLSSAGAAASAAKGDYDVTASAAVAGLGTDLDNYDVRYVRGTLAVAARSLTITADDRSKTYGEALSLGTSRFSTGAGELVNGDSVASVTLSSAGAAASAAKGDYDVTASAAVAGLGTDLDNYDVRYVRGTLAVAARSLTITADDRSKTYGEALSLGTSRFSTGAGELVNGDSVASVTLSSAGAAASAAKGDYDVTASAAVAGLGTDLDNYDVRYVRGTLAVAARSLTITADDRSKTYGEALSLGTSRFSTGAGELVNGDSVASVTLSSAGAAASAAKGDYDVTASAAVAGLGTDLDNYDVRYVRGTLAVAARSLTITADDRSKTYGEALSLGTSRFSTGAGELVNGDSVASVTLSSAGAAASAAKGDYDVTASAAVAGLGTDLDNYDVRYVRGTLAVAARSLTITADDRSKTYGEALSLGTSRFSTGAGELVNGDSVASVTLSSAGAAASAAKGDYDVTASAAVAGLGTDLDNYDVRYVRGTLAVAARSLTITADDRSKTYGEALSLGTSRFSTGAGELVNGDSVASVTLSSAGAAASAAKGDYDVTASAAVAGLGTDLDNYDVRYVRGTLAVAARSLTITADDRSKTYGEALSLGTSRFSTGAGELVNGDSVASVTLSSAGAAASAAKGDYDVTASAAVAGLGTDLDNYDVRYVRGTLAVAARSLTITADDRSKTYGEALSLGTSRFSTGAGELVNGDSVASVTLSSAGAAASAAKGDYDVTASAAVAGLGTDLDNYDVRYVRGTLAVAARSLTITADDRSKTYGEALSLGTSRFSTGAGELVNGDSVASVTLSSAGAAASAAKGDYDVTASAAVAGLGTDLDNYDVRYVRGTLAVAARSLTITADDRSKTYGEALSLGTSRFSTGAGELVNGDSVASVTLSSAGAAASAAVTAGGYPVNVSNATGSGLGNYSISYTNGTLTVDKAPLTITAADKSRTYGDVNPALTGTISGIKNGDAITASYSTSASAGSPVGGYAIVPAAVDASPAKLGNYDVTLNNGTLTVGQRSLTVTANNRSKTYGSELVLGSTAFSTGAGQLVNGDSVARVTLSSAGAAASAAVTAGGYPVNVSNATGSGLGNYSISYTNGTLTVDKAPLTITAADKSRTYGDVNPALTGTISGIKNGDAITASYSTSASAGSPVGGYAIVPAAVDASPAKLGNYDVTLNNGTLTVGQRSLTVTANNRSKTYGSELVLGSTAFSTGAGQLVNGDSVTGVTLTSAGAAATAAVTAGGYPVNVSNATGSGLGNYSISYTNGTLTVDKAPLTITAADKSRTYGDVNPALTGTISGIKNGDAITASYSTSASAGSPVGGYAIVPAAVDASPAKLGNYDVTLNNGTLTVGQRLLTVTANNRSKTYGSELVLGSTAFSTGAGQLVNGDSVTGVTLTSAGAAATAAVTAGGYPVNVSNATGSGLGNYSISYANGTLTVNKAPLTITADNKTKTVGAANPVLTGTISGIKNGDAITASYTTSATQSSSVGSYAIMPAAVDASPGKLSNYDVTLNPGTLRVLYDWDGYLQPINDTAHQIGIAQSKFKLGQTIPTKFQVKDSVGNVVQQTGSPTFSSTYRGSSCDNNATTDTVPTVAPMNGATFSWDGSKYQYNWSTKGLTAGEYRIFANLADGTAHYTDICLTK